MPANSDRDAIVDAASRTLRELFDLKYGGMAKLGWGPRLRSRFGYHTPDEWYEAVVFGKVTKETEWLDVGCGRDTFPSNKPTAKLLAARCRLLVGLDPTDNIDDNPYVHECVKDYIESYVTDRRFDLITLRMVAEHIERPEAAVAAMARLLKPKGEVVLYTVKKWAPVSMIAKVTPMSVHHVAKRILWGAQPRDTFPVVYRMNTRRTLRRLFDRHGLKEQCFLSLGDCRSFQRWKSLNFLELSIWKILSLLGLDYPEACILAIYGKPPKTL